MSRAARTLRARRLELIRRVDLERQDFRDRIQGIQGTVGSLAQGFSLTRWLGASPLLLASGAILTLVLGRGRVLRTFGAGVAMLGILRRYRNTFQLLGHVVSELRDSQSVRRSR
ncbi:MAG: hypothetical protein Q8N51_15915 [Gammaproteobacteria bacterium]|nr:hypothetical protein [Gammaproteobacteria bacterium]